MTMQELRGDSRVIYRSAKIGQDGNLGASKVHIIISYLLGIA